MDGKAQSSQVQVTRINGGREFIVDEGLAPGDVIVAEGVGLLREGTPIKAKTASSASAAQTSAAQADAAQADAAQADQASSSPVTTTEN